LAISNVPGIGPKFCSGTLIGPDLFLTAAHCREAFAAKTYVSMNFEYTLNAPELKKEEFYEVESVLEDGFNSAPSLDYMILKLRGTPGLKYGSTPLRFFAPLPQERITIIQHPEGFPKKVHSGTVLEADHKRIKYSNLDTQGGSSGSGVLDSEGYLVGVHIQGGCWTYGGTNEAVSLEAITEKSRILRGILERSPQ
jgi:V8-like Glu-specific endopeptidase